MTTTQCPGSWSRSAVDGTVIHGARRVTGQCPVCGRRVAFVSAETFRDGVYIGKLDRMLGRHDVPTAKAAVDA